MLFPLRRLKPIGIVLLGVALGAYWWLNQSGPDGWLREWEQNHLGVQIPLLNAAIAILLGVLTVVVVVVLLHIPYHVALNYRIQKQAAVLPFSVTQLQNPQVILVQFAGVDDESKRYRVPDEQAFCQATVQGWQNVLVNLTHVNFLPRKTLGMLLQLHKQLGLKCGKLVLSNLDPMNAEVFRITKLDRVLSIAADEKAGVRMFASGDG